MTDEGYLFEMQRLAFEMEQVADNYGGKDRTINVIITGLIDESATGLQKIKAIYNEIRPDWKKLKITKVKDLLPKWELYLHKFFLAIFRRKKHVQGFRKPWFEDYK